MIVKVLNRNKDYLIRDRFGGIQYEFPPDKVVGIPVEAAEHIFGYGLPEKEKEKKFMRMGLANRPDGRKLWDNVKLRVGVEQTGVVREAA